MKLGLMGGTFNPIHIGHLKIASKVLDSFDLAKIIFIPSGNPPHKRAGDIIDAFHRLKMIESAINDDKRLEVSDIEIKRKGKSYTLDTIKQVKELYGRDTEIYFIAGADSALDLPNWKNPSEILSISHFVAVERPGFSLRELGANYQKKIIAVEGISINISSSDIRERIKQGRSIKKLVPASVEKYIRRNGLYI
jgi:nicotinate-nucleotide adenylyltransferase